MLSLWIVMYRVNTGFVYGWVCKADSAESANEQFFSAINTPELVTVLFTSEVESNVVDALFEIAKGQ